MQQPSACIGSVEQSVGGVGEVECAHTQPVYGPLSGTTLVSRYQKKHSPAHTIPHTILYRFPPSTTNYHGVIPVQCMHLSYCTTSNQVLFGYLWVWSPPLHTPYISSPSHCPPFAKCNLFCCSTEIMSSVSSLSLNSLFETLSFNQYMLCTNCVNFCHQLRGVECDNPHASMQSPPASSGNGL